MMDEKEKKKWISDTAVKIYCSLVQTRFGYDDNESHAIRMADCLWSGLSGRGYFSSHFDKSPERKKELEDCPDCGSTAAIWREDGVVNIGCRAYRCKGHSVRITSHHSAETSIEMWNERAISMKSNKPTP